MEWTAQQERALDLAGQWIKARDRPIFRLFGYAGTGKTTIARHLAATADGVVRFAAPTAKAASVMRAKGCTNASTIHKLIYDAVPKRTPKQRENDIDVDFEKKDDPNALRHAKLLVIDECSMIGEKIGRDLLSFGIPIMVLGDPAQLPPVEGAGFFTEAEPDILLTDIVRQARESPIIEMATRIRTGQRIEPGEYVGPEKRVSVVMRRKDLNEDYPLDWDQIIVGKNATRAEVNQMCRRLLGYKTELPESGERIVALRNNYGDNVWNGETYLVNSSEPHWENEAEHLDMRIEDTESEESVIMNVRAWIAPFIGQKVDRNYALDANEFDYGYALTCHKSQGSQWSGVAVLNEAHCFRDKARNWLYTAVTRAADRVLIAT